MNCNGAWHCDTDECKTDESDINTSQMQSLETPDMDSVCLVVKVQLLARLICESMYC